MFSSRTCEVEQPRHLSSPEPVPCAELRTLCAGRTGKPTSPSETLQLLRPGFVLSPLWALETRLYACVSEPGTVRHSQPREPPASTSSRLEWEEQRTPSNLNSAPWCPASPSSETRRVGCAPTLLERMAGPVPSPLQTPWALPVSALLRPAPAPEPRVWAPPRSGRSLRALHLALASLALDPSRLFNTTLAIKGHSDRGKRRTRVACCPDRDRPLLLPRSPVSGINLGSQNPVGGGTCR